MRQKSCIQGCHGETLVGSERAYSNKIQNKGRVKYVAVVHDLDELMQVSDVILADRYNDDIADALDKVYTRDLYFTD